MSDAGSPVPPPPPSVPAPTSDQRNWAMGAHLASFVGAFVAGLAVLGPLVVWLVKREDHPFIEEHAKEALNFQLTWTVGAFVGGIVAGLGALLTLGIGLVVIVPLAIVLGVLWFVWTIQGALAASRGEPYRYRMTVRLIT